MMLDIARSLNRPIGPSAATAAAPRSRAWRCSPDAPASMHFSRSPFIAFAVTAMIGRSPELVEPRG